MSRFISFIVSVVFFTSIIMAIGSYLFIAIILSIVPAIIHQVFMADAEKKAQKTAHDEFIAGEEKAADREKLQVANNKRKWQDALLTDDQKHFRDLFVSKLHLNEIECGEKIMTDVDDVYMYEMLEKIEEKTIDFRDSLATRGLSCSAQQSYNVAIGRNYLAAQQDMAMQQQQAALNRQQCVSGSLASLLGESNAI